MKPSYDILLIYAVCENNQIYKFGRFSDISYCDDDISFWSEIGDKKGFYNEYCFEICVKGCYVDIPTPSQLKNYLNGHRYKNIKKILTFLQIRNKIKYFYMIHSSTSIINTEPSFCYGEKITSRESHKINEKEAIEIMNSAK